jgi:hypothetical protein
MRNGTSCPFLSFLKKNDDDYPSTLRRSKSGTLYAERNL